MKKIASLLFFCSSLAFAEQAPPQLIVQLVVDQLRGDLIHQYQTSFGPAGFNRLLSHGVDFQNAHHPHAYTVTCVGHATISTGSYPALHGVIANEWYDRHTGKDTYCMNDSNSTILPTSRTKIEQPGRSPRQLLASTLGDEIVLAQKGRAFGVSLKDRSAITLAGHAGKAFWFDKENGGFITSDYYYERYPEWVIAWNQHYEPKEEIWALSKPKENYRYAQSPGFNNAFPTFNAHFPHSTGAPDNPLYYKLFSMTPNADEVTSEFAQQLLRHEKLGQSPGKTDYLAISFSAVDAVGHQFGPNSLESEDTLLRLDQTLATLLNTLDKEVGLKNTLIVLTADHGVTDSPAYLAAHQITATPAVDVAHLQKTIEDTLTSQFKLPQNALQAVKLPYIYMDHRVINQHSLSLRTITEKLVEVLNQQPGIFRAFSLPLTDTSANWLSQKVDKMAFTKRAGDLYIVPPPYQSLADKTIRVDHGTPWRYDSYVPLLFVNPAFKPQHISTPARTTDIAATLASILQIKAPSAAIGKPLQPVAQYYGR